MSNFPDAEEIVDPSTTNPLSQHKEIILDSDAQDSQSSEENEATMNKENGADPMDFELSLFPASSIFGANVFHQLQGEFTKNLKVCLIKYFINAIFAQNLFEWFAISLILCGI